MMQKASGEGVADQSKAPPASPKRNTTVLGTNNIFTLPSELYPERPFPLRDHCKGYYCPLAATLKAYLRYDGRYGSQPQTVARYRARLSRALWNLKKENLIELETLDYGLVQYRLTSNGLNLMRRSQNSNRPKQARKGIYDLPRRATKNRLKALNLTMRNPMIQERDRGQVSDLFMNYLDSVTDREVILTYKSEEKNPDAPLLFLPYRTRFTSTDRKQANLKTFESIWSNSVLNFKTAVFVTLTTDPKMHTSAYHANRHFQKALNRLLSFLTKKNEKRPKYLNVHEFQKNGLLHSHIIIFGLDYLMDYRRLSEVWQRCGQGKIVHIYGLRSNGTAWTWAHARPRDAEKGKGVDTYLKKYLKKALFNPDELELYWTFGKRFFTYARALRPASPRSPYLGPPLAFIGSALPDMIPVLVARRSRLLWAKIRAANYEAATGPPQW